MKVFRKLLPALAAAGLALTGGAAQAIVWDGAKPAPGIYFHWYEPSFYAGFAPRISRKL